MFMKNSLALSLGLAVSLVGCSGGSPDPSSSNPSTTLASATGVGAKGIIKKGVVVAYEVNADGSKGKEIGRTTSDDNGKYSIGILDTYTLGQAILIELTNSDETAMTCDALSGCGSISYGQDMKLSSGFTMKSILAPVDKGESISGQITPFTHMAATAALEELKNGKSAKVAVSDGNSQISAMVGFNIQSTLPFDITKDSKVTGDAVKYALWLAAFSDLIFKNGGDVNSILTAWAEEFADGDFDGGKKVNLKALLAELKNQLNDSRNTDLDSNARNSVDANQTKLDSLIGDDGHYDPKPLDENDIDATDVQRAKNMISATRTWVNSFSQLQNPADALTDDIDAVTEALDGNTSAVLNTGVIAMYRAIQVIVDAKLSGSPVPSSFKIRDEHENEIGSASLVFIEESGKPISFQLISQNLNGDVSVAYKVNLTQTWDELVAAAEKAGNIAGTITAGYINDSEVSAVLNGMSFDVAFKKAYKPAIAKQIIVTGPISLKVASSGNTVSTDDATIKLVTLSEGLTEAWSLLPTTLVSSVSLPKMQRNGGDGNQLSVSLEMDETALIDPFAFKRGEGAVWVNKHISDGNVLGFANENLSSLINAHYAPAGLPWLSDKADAAYFGLGKDNALYSLSGTVNTDQAALADTLFKSTYQADSRVVDTGKWRMSYSANDSYGDKVGTHVVGLLKLDTRSSLVDFINAKLKISTSLALSGLPVAFAGIVLNTDLETVDANNVSMSLSYNGRDLDLIFASQNDTQFSLIASNGQGVKLEANYADVNGKTQVTSGSVTVDGTAVGTISTSNGLTIIRYNDGSLESFE